LIELNDTQPQSELMSTQILELVGDSAAEMAGEGGVQAVLESIEAKRASAAVHELPG
jgi:hypothetical protein